VLNLSEFLHLSDRSVLNAEAGDTGHGGNISINAPFFIGSGKSDSIANAVRGRGGNINITTNSILGLDFRNQLTPNNDITASSEFGVNGTVQITTPDVNPNFGLVELPVNLVDSSQLIATGCANTNDSSFVATERGGIPQNLTQDIRNDRPWSDARDISLYRKTGEVTPQISSSPETLVQATSCHRNALGKIELVADDKSSVQVQPSLTCAPVSQN
jgi:large exoprotein involved in heme utilization and adhesion